MGYILAHQCLNEGPAQWYAVHGPGLARETKEQVMADQATIERTAEALFIQVVAAAFANKAQGVDYRIAAAEARKAAQVFHSSKPVY